MIRAKMLILSLYNRLNGICSSIFRTLEVIFSRPKVPLPRYEQKQLFVVSENGLLALSVLFLALLKLF